MATALNTPTDNELSLLAVRVGAFLQQRGLRVVTAESCTGGLVSKLLTDVPGSSQWFDCGYITYSNEAKQRDLGVAAETLRLFGAVSEETVEQMAAGALVRTAADLAVAVSGVAGPDGGTIANPAGSVWFALAAGGAAGGTEGAAPGVEISAVHHQLTGDRDAVRRQSAAIALELLMEP
ncbi:MAG: nicotinamide-nucleotide amidohydrolase family protein [Pseudomonadota bacterium]